MNKVWGYDYLGDGHTIDVHISALRKKLEANAEQRYITTVWRVGYRFEVKHDQPCIFHRGATKENHAHTLVAKHTLATSIRLHAGGFAGDSTPDAISDTGNHLLLRR